MHNSDILLVFQSFCLHMSVCACVCVSGYWGVSVSSGQPWGDRGLVRACSPPLTALRFINSCQPLSSSSHLSAPSTPIWRSALKSNGSNKRKPPVTNEKRASDKYLWDTCRSSLYDTGCPKSDGKQTHVILFNTLITGSLSVLAVTQRM